MELPELNQKDVLMMLGINWKKLREYEEAGKLRVVRISLGTVRYFRSDVEKLQKEVQDGEKETA